MDIEGEIIKIVIFGVYVFFVLVIGYIAKEYFLPFSKIKKDVDTKKPSALEKGKSWLWSAVILALAFSGIFLGISSVSESNEDLFWIYVRYIGYYFLFFVYLHIIYWLGKLILKEKLKI